MREPTPTARGNPARRRRAVLLGLIGASAGSMAGLLWLTSAPRADAALVVVVTNLVLAGGPALAVLCAAGGYGRALVRTTGAPPSLALPIGLAVLIWLVQAAGSLGGVGPVWSFVLLAPGWALLAGAARAGIRAWPAWRGPSAGWVLAGPALAVMLLAACSAPGWLWASEAHGYDVLSYHLHLPREWIELGRIRPLEHNVYSHLPSGMEGLFVLLLGLMGTEHSAEFLSSNGARVLAPALLHAMVALAAAWQCASLAQRWTHDPESTETSRSDRGHSGLIAAAVLTTPWVVVTGSLAYNEMAVVLLGAAALHAANHHGFSATARGAWCGLLVGAACLCKPTALVLLAPGVALVLALRVPWRCWATMGLAGAGVGVLVLLPWLLRNGVWTGNPVFPYLSGVFGSGSWSEEQVQRYAQAHHGDALEGLRLLVLPDANGVLRGLRHDQWWWWFSAVALGGLGALAALLGPSRTRARHSTLLALGLLVIGLLGWAVLTHHQARFLLPLVPIGAVLLAMGARSARRLGPALLVVLVIAQSWQTLRVTVDQKNGSPFAIAGMSLGFFTGEGLPTETLKILPERWLNQPSVREQGGVCLLGDATPMYLLDSALYSTTWDIGPIGALVRDHPSYPNAWIRGLRARGVRWLLVNESELGRLLQAGWLDPELKPERVAALLDRLELVREWPAQKRAVYFVPNLVPDRMPDRMPDE